jgi:hypothetical protein
VPPVDTSERAVHRKMGGSSRLYAIGYESLRDTRARLSLGAAFTLT